MYKILMLSISLFLNPAVANQNVKHTLDSKIQTFINENSQFINQYPPKFKNNKHKKKVISKTKKILKKISKTNLDEILNFDLLINIAYIYSMAHNLDLGTGQLAKEIFERALSIQPDSKKGNYLFGMYLVSTSKYFFESEIYLIKALDLGEKDALYTLGLIEIKKGNNENGLKYLENYSKTNPNNHHVLKVIDAIKNERINFIDEND